jgi:hypothetical protein
MKTYQVELKRVSYVNLTVEADNPEAAEDAAWLELQTADYDVFDAEWLLENIEVIHDTNCPATDGFGCHCDSITQEQTA